MPASPLKKTWPTSVDDDVGSHVGVEGAEVAVGTWRRGVQLPVVAGVQKARVEGVEGGVVRGTGTDRMGYRVAVVEVDGLTGGHLDSRLEGEVGNERLSGILGEVAAAHHRSRANVGVSEERGDRGVPHREDAQLVVVGGIHPRMEHPADGVVEPPTQTSTLLPGHELVSALTVAAAEVEVRVPVVQSASEAFGVVETDDLR